MRYAEIIVGLLALGAPEVVMGQSGVTFASASITTSASVVGTIAVAGARNLAFGTVSSGGAAKSIAYTDATSGGKFTVSATAGSVLEYYVTTTDLTYNNGSVQTLPLTFASASA